MTTKQRIRNQNLVLPELSYIIVGALFETFNELGYGYKEKQYCRAVKHILEKRGLKVKMEVRVPLEFQSSSVGDYFLDLLVEDKIVVEMKVGGKFRKADFEQVKAYLKATSTPLGILARFDVNGVTFHRVLTPAHS